MLPYANRRPKLLLSRGLRFRVSLAVPMLIVVVNRMAYFAQINNRKQSKYQSLYYRDKDSERRKHDRHNKMCEWRI
jgi:hypothetical protein